jgi:hypothetical protein
LPIPSLAVGIDKERESQPSTPVRLVPSPAAARAVRAAGGTYDAPLCPYSRCGRRFALRRLDVVMLHLFEAEIACVRAVYSLRAAGTRQQHR